MATKTANDLQLSDLAGLTVTEYEKCKAQAEKQLRSDLGSGPRRDDFKRESASIWDLSDVAAGLAFLAALAISSTHIVSHMAAAVDAAGLVGAGGAGIVLGADLVVGVHQVAFIVLAETSAILFMILGGGVQSSGGKATAIVWRVIFYALALLSALFVLVANLQSGIGLLESVMPPAITLGLGAYFERKLAAAWDVRRDVDQRYRAALDDYESAVADITNHSRYSVIMRQTIADRLVAKNKRLAIPLELLQQAVAREQLRDQVWERSDRAVLAQVYRMVQDGTATPKKDRARRSSPPTGRENGHSAPVILSAGAGVNGADRRS